MSLASKCKAPPLKIDSSEGVKKGPKNGNNVSFVHRIILGCWDEKVKRLESNYLDNGMPDY